MKSRMKHTIKFKFPLGDEGRIAGGDRSTPLGPLSIDTDEKGVISIRNFDNASIEERLALVQEIGKRSEIPLFKGSVEHGYAAAHIKDLDCCPRCGGRTERRYANFVYLTQLMLRVMVVPAGHFCTACPSVIVEEDLIIGGISEKRFKYKCTIGLDFDKKKEPEFFKTWDGERRVFIFDEDECLEGVTTHAELARLQEIEVSAHPIVSLNLAKKKAIKKKRDKLAKQSRKKNRKK